MCMRGWGGGGGTGGSVCMCFKGLSPYVRSLFKVSYTSHILCKGGIERSGITWVKAAESGGGETIGVLH